MSVYWENDLFANFSCECKPGYMLNDDGFACDSEYSAISLFINDKTHQCIS